MKLLHSVCTKLIYAKLCLTECAISYVVDYNFFQGGNINMATKANYPISEIGKGKVGFTTTRTIIETAFYGNNVVKVNTLKEAYNLAKNSPGTITTDMPIYKGREHRT